MANHVYKITEYAGSSPTGVEEAINNAVARAKQDFPNLRWFQLVETRGQIDGGQVAHWQVVIKVGATLD
jgi:dodecin